MTRPKPKGRPKEYGIKVVSGVRFRLTDEEERIEWEMMKPNERGDLITERFKKREILDNA